MMISHINRSKILDQIVVLKSYGTLLKAKLYLKKRDRDGLDTKSIQGNVYKVN